MSRFSISVAISSFFLASALHAREVEGINLPETVSVEGKQLKLNGAGLRKKLFFKVYVAGLYVESPSKEATSLISSDQAKQVHMWMLRDVDKGRMGDAIRDGFVSNSRPRMGSLRARLERLISLLPDIKKGDEFVISYIPNVGTVLSGRGEQSVIEGKDF